MTYIKIFIAVSGLALLTACGGGKGTAPTTDAAKLQAELQKAKDAQAEAETSRDVALSVQATNENAMEKAGRLQKNAETERDTARDERDNALLAKGNADKEITRLKNELATAISERDSARGDKNAANLRITELEGELSTATSAKKSADADVLRLTQELADANRALSTANADVLRLTGGLKTVTGDKDTAESQRDTARVERDNANLRITELQGELSTATGERDTANGRITTLEGQLSTATGERDTAKGRITTLEGELSTATGERDTANDRITELEDELQTAISERNAETGDKNTANLRITELEGELSTAIGERDTANGTITTLRGELSTAIGERDTARGRIITLQGELLTAQGALNTARGRITTLEGELSTVTGERDTANGRITDLEGELSTAQGALNTAKGRITTLEGELQTATGERDTARDRITELEGELSTAISERNAETGDKNTANLRITELEGELSTAIGERDTANGTITTLRGELSTAIGERDTARGRITTLEGELSTAIGERDTANGRITTLEGELSTTEGERDTANGKVTDLQGKLSTAEGERDTANGKVTDLQGELSTAQGALNTARGRITTLEGQLSTATDERDTARGRITELEGELSTAIGERDTANGTITTLRGELSTAQGTLNTARGRITELEGELSTATTDKNAANLRITELEGQLQTATNDKNAADAEVLRLTGDLEAANTEITRLDQFIRPTYATWKLAVNPEAVPNIITPQNQFLQADADSISTEGTTAGPDDVQTLNLLTATFDGLPLDEEAADGVAFFQGQIHRASYNYAGVFSGTDLGAPITNTAGTVAIWYGSFDHTLNPSKDFALTITFDRTGGTLDAFVRAGIANNSFIFDDVRFDTRGLITGEVLYVTFAHNDPTATPTTQTATLRGLIGEAGAVGVFVGEVGSNFAGGFVAHPTAKLDSNKINFADWGGVDGDHRTDVPNADNTGTEPLLYGVASVGNSNPVGNFIHGLATVDGKGFNFVGTSYASATVIGDVLYLGADRTSGVAFSRVNEKYYAGLLPTTDLGVPITAKDLSVTWDAQFTLNSRGGAFVNPSFKMRVRFNGNGGTINSGTAAGRGFTNGGVDLRKIETLHLSRGTITIAGKFGRDGVLYGTVSTATLTGLIGVNGAVGAFVGATLSGGFVAYPNVANTINAADWGGTAGNPKEMITAGIDKIIAGKAGTAILLNGFASVVNDGSSVNFIQGLPTLRGKGFKFAGTSFSDEDVYGDVLLLDEGSSSGVAFSHVSGTGVMDRKYYAGLLPGTNLGAPITDINTDVIWNAQFGAVLGGFCCDTQKYSHLGFTMQVIFDGSGGTINSGTVSNGEFTKGSVTVPYTNITSPSFDGSDDFNIEGKFGNDGLLYGTVVNLDENIKAALTGLIGVNGAVGAFVGIGRRGTNIAGGFVAHPIATVNFVNWAGFSGNRRTTVINADNTGAEPLLNGATSVVNSGPRVNFIERLAKSDGQGFNFAGTPFANATVFGDVLYLDEDRTSGSGIAFSRVSGTGVTGDKYYAGLLPGTALGSRITDPNTSAIWDARLMGVFKISNPKRYSSLNFKMQVIFDGNEGTINSGTVSGDSFTPEGISTSDFGKFNIEGKFGRDGLLYGKVGTNLEGTLTGLIGVDGAVGAFAFAGDFISYAGGFVAAPPQ